MLKVTLSDSRRPLFSHFADCFPGNFLSIITLRLFLEISYWYTYVARAYSKHWRHGYVFGGTFVLKKGILFTWPPEQMSFLTISNENNFFKTQGTRLGAIVAPNKGLEYLQVACRKWSAREIMALFSRTVLLCMYFSSFLKVFVVVVV